ncbi:MAG: peptidase T [Clostridiales bacterium]|nr:peptidase T [Clostridiales bacterium]
MSETVDRFLKYIAIDSKSDDASGQHPSTSSQFAFADMLYEELRSIGITDITYDREHCYIYVKLKGNDPECISKIGFIAHMDTSPEAEGKDIYPSIIDGYDGGDIVLNKKLNIVLSPESFPELKRYKGQSLIVTDGTTLLGSDDKSGIAEIVTMLNYFQTHPEVPHGEIRAAFTPDEEIGEGTEYFDIDLFDADFAYTVDGGEIGEISYENFNAALAIVTVKGVNVHPGEAYKKMVNSQKIAMEFNSLLPADMCPEETKDYQGFFHLISMEGSTELTTLSYLVREHDSKLFEEKKALLNEAAEKLNANYGRRVTVDIADSYYNMRSKIVPDYMFLVNEACAAMERVGINPLIKPIRGGTDGAMLSFKGLPCPNLCAGGHNFHGIYEFVPVESMDKISELLIEIVKAF